MRAGPSVRIAATMVLLAGTASGCIDFLEPEELDPRRGELRVDLLVTDTADARAQIGGRLLRARGEDGMLVPVLDSTLRLFGRTLAPEPGGGKDALTYRADWSLTVAERDRDRIRLEGPVTDASRGRAHLTFPLIARAGPDSVAPAEDGDLRLPLAPGSADAYGNVESLSWSLVVSADSGPSLLIMRGTGRPPDTLRIARNLLATNSSRAPVEALFWTRMHARRSSESLSYELQFNATTAVDWRVFLE